MEDLIQKYKIEKKQRKNRFILLIISSFVIALSLNVLLFNTNMGSYIQTNILNSKENFSSQKTANLYLEKEKNTGNILIQLNSGANLHKIVSLTFTLTYDAENIKIIDKIKSNDDISLIDLTLGNDEGFKTFVINFNNPTDVKKGEKILTFVLENKGDGKPIINLTGASIKDDNNDEYLLSTSGIES